MKKATMRMGRGFVLVNHPNPQADAIEGDWTVRVERGEMTNLTERQPVQPR